MKIYFDTMIISRMRNGICYINISDYLKQKRGNHTYYYSNAHILDLQNYNTNEKYLDLDYIGNYIGKNYLCKYFNQPTKIFDILPKDAFDDALQLENNDTTESLNEMLNDPIFKPFENNISLPENIIDDKYLENIPEEYRLYLENIIKK